MPEPEHRLAQSLGGVEPQQAGIAVQAQEVMAQSPVLEPLVVKAVTSPSMSLVIMSEVAAMQDVVEQHPSALAVHRRNHLVLRQPQHPVQNIHHGAGKRPQSEMLQLTF